MIEKNIKNAHFVVITPDKFVDEAVKLFSQKKEELTTPGQVSRDQRQLFVFTPEQFKGLEERDVLLYRLFEEDDFFAINNVLSTEQPLDIDVRHNKALHKLIVSLTRNTDKIFFYQPLVHALRYIINPFKGQVESFRDNEDISTSIVSTPEEWSKQKNKFMEHGLIHTDLNKKESSIDLNPSLGITQSQPIEPMQVMYKKLETNFPILREAIYTFL